MDERMLDVKQVMERLRVSKSFAYKLIHQLNEEMAAAGNITIPGKVSKRYLEQRLFTQPGEKRVGRDGRL